MDQLNARCYGIESEKGSYIRTLETKLQHREYELSKALQSVAQLKSLLNQEETLRKAKDDASEKTLRRLEQELLKVRLELQDSKRRNSFDEKEFESFHRHENSRPHMSVVVPQTTKSYSNHAGPGLSSGEKILPKIIYRFRKLY